MTSEFQTVAKFTQFWQKIIFLHVHALRKKVIPNVLADSEDQKKNQLFHVFNFIIS